MSNVTENTFNHKVNFTLFPSEPLLGINTINASVKCADEQFRNVLSIEVGLLFFKVSYSNMIWK